MNAQYIYESSRKFMTPRGWPNTKQARLELAGGYFTHKKTSRSPILECYAGGGYGLATYAVRNVWIKQPAIPYTLYDLTIPSQNWNVFVQPAIGLRSRRSHIALSAKVNYMGFIQPSIESNRSDNQPSNGPVTSYEDVARFEKLTQLLDSHCLFLEPALTASTGGKRIRILVQLFSWITISNPSQYKVISPSQTFARLGLVLNLNQKSDSHP